MSFQRNFSKCWSSSNEFSFGNFMHFPSNPIIFLEFSHANVNSLALHPLSISIYRRHFLLSCLQPVEEKRRGFVKYCYGKDSLFARRFCVTQRTCESFDIIFWHSRASLSCISSFRSVCFNLYWNLLNIPSANSVLYFRFICVSLSTLSIFFHIFMKQTSGSDQWIQIHLAHFYSRHCDALISFFYGSTSSTLLSLSFYVLQFHFISSLEGHCSCAWEKFIFKKVLRFFPWEPRQAQNNCSKNYLF